MKVSFADYETKEVFSQDAATNSICDIMKALKTMPRYEGYNINLIYRGMLLNNLELMPDTLNVLISSQCLSLLKA